MPLAERWNGAECLIKGLILLIAIIVDTLINRRDEQTAQQRDI